MGEEVDRRIKTGDFIVLSSVEEGDRAFLASGVGLAENDVVAVAGARTRRCVFEVHPMTYGVSWQTGEGRELQGDDTDLRMREGALQEKEQREAILSQLDGKSVRYGQVVQLVHVHSGNKFLAGEEGEAASLEQTCSKVFFRTGAGNKCWFKFMPVDEGAQEGGLMKVGAGVALLHVCTAAPGRTTRETTR